MSSDIDLYLRNYHHNQNSEHTHTPKVSSCPSQPFSPTRPHLLSQATTDLSLQISWCSLEVYVDESAQCILFFVWILSFGITILRLSMLLPVSLIHSFLKI